MQEIALPTPDGDARAFTFTPKGEGPWPAAIIFMDAPAIRPALFEFGERLARQRLLHPAARHVLARRPYEPINVKEVFADEAKRREVFGKLMARPVRRSSWSTPRPSSTTWPRSRR
jgi:carboxymethylenebutenolidase